jgi:hypothetical protein
MDKELRYIHPMHIKLIHDELYQLFCDVRDYDLVKEAVMRRLDYIDSGVIGLLISGKVYWNTTDRAHWESIYGDTDPISVKSDYDVYKEERESSTPWKGKKS